MLKRKGRTAFLDEVRTKRGDPALIESFRNTARVNRKQAIEYLNDENLCYPSLYVLRNEIEKEQLTEQLCKRYRLAADFTRQEKIKAKSQKPTAHSTLKWIIQTGGEENIDKTYLQKLDKAAVYMTAIYKDRSVLPDVARMIFFRCRNELPYHDLVWAFLEMQDPHSLALVADRLRSSDSREGDCARRLLAFIPGIDRKQTNEGERQFHRFQEWMEQNGPYLFYKGETFDTIDRPTSYITNHGAKYIGVFVSVHDGEPLSNLTKKERRWLRRFEDLPIDSQSLLAAYSLEMRRKKREDWLKWMERPIKKQLKEAGDSSHA